MTKTMTETDLTTTVEALLDDGEKALRAILTAEGYGTETERAASEYRRAMTPIAYVVLHNLPEDADARMVSAYIRNRIAAEAGLSEQNAHNRVQRDRMAALDHWRAALAAEARRRKMMAE